MILLPPRIDPSIALTSETIFYHMAASS